MQNDKVVFVQTNYALFSLAPHNLADVAKHCCAVAAFDLESSLCKDSVSVSVCFCFYWRLKLLTSRITRIQIVQVWTFTPPNSDFIAFHRLIAFNIKYLSAFRV